MINTIDLRTNTKVLEYFPDTTYQELLDSIQDLLVLKTWESLDSQVWDDGLLLYNRVFRKENQDASTYKYVRIGFYNGATTGLFLSCCSDYNPDTNQLINENWYPSFDIVNQRWDDQQISGKLFLFISEMWFAWLNMSQKYTGSQTGNGLSGCFEIFTANPLDNTPHFVWLNTYQLSLDTTLVSPVQTLSQIGNTSALGTRITTNIGSWGYGLAANSIDIIPSNKAPFSNGKDFHGYDLITSFDCNTLNPYVKGKIAGLKILSPKNFQTRDIAKIKVNSDYMVDPSEIEKDHFIISTENGSFAVPM